MQVQIQPSPKLSPGGAEAGSPLPTSPYVGTFAWRLLDAMHLMLDPSTSTVYIHSLKQVERHYAKCGMHQLTRWSLFAGTGISTKLVLVITDY